MTCGNYDRQFVCDLLAQVDNKIALFTNKDYKNNIYDLGLKTEPKKYLDLLDVRDILEKVISCNTCYCDEDIEDIINVAKNKINKC